MRLAIFLCACSLAARAGTPEPREVSPAHEAPPPEDQPWSLDLTVHDVGWLDANDDAVGTGGCAQ